MSVCGLVEIILHHRDGYMKTHQLYHLLHIALTGHLTYKITSSCGHR
jgi:hypothetical protein